MLFSNVSNISLMIKLDILVQDGLVFAIMGYICICGPAVHID